MTTLTDFCENILFSDSLFKKLECVEEVDFKTCRSLDVLPDLPARPVELSFSQNRTVKLPSIKDLEDERQRGILLHFF